MEKGRDSTIEDTLKSFKRVGQIKPHRGHRLFKYTVATGKLSPVPLLHPDQGKSNKKAVIAEQGHIYISALNIKNAIKKIAQYHGIVVDLKNI